MMRYLAMLVDEDKEEEEDMYVHETYVNKAGVQEDDENAGKTQCYRCEKWYCRIHRHLRDVHRENSDGTPYVAPPILPLDSSLSLETVNTIVKNKRSSAEMNNSAQYTSNLNSSSSKAGSDGEEELCSKGKAQCPICNNWYSRVRRHLRDVHKIDSSVVKINGGSGAVSSSNSSSSSSGSGSKMPEQHALEPPSKKGKKGSSITLIDAQLVSAEQLVSIVPPKGVAMKEKEKGKKIDSTDVILVPSTNSRLVKEDHRESKRTHKKDK